MKLSVNTSGIIRQTIVVASLSLLATAVVVGFTSTSAQNISIRTVGSTAGARRQKAVFVRSKALLVRADVIEEKLLKRPEFAALGFALTREQEEADFIIELRHDVLTKYVYTVIETRTQTVVAGGKVSSLGGTVGGKVAKRFVKEMARRAAESRP